MITNRLIAEEDYELLQESLAQDEHHNDTPPEFFYQIGSLTQVYEDEQGPILFCRAVKALRLDIQFLDNEDAKRNMAAMIEGYPVMEEKARENGFTEIIFQTNSNLLGWFCKKRFGFEVSNGELRKQIGTAFNGLRN